MPNGEFVSQVAGECKGPQKTGPKQSVTISVEEPGSLSFFCKKRGADNVCGISPSGGKCVFRALDFAGQAIDPVGMGEHNSDLVKEYVEVRPNTAAAFISEDLGLTQGATSRIIAGLRLTGEIVDGDRAVIRGGHPLTPLKAVRRKP